VTVEVQRPTWKLECGQWVRVRVGTEIELVATVRGYKPADGIYYLGWDSTDSPPQPGSADFERLYGN